ncbi:DUF6730 family protein [Salinimicrobium sp. TH3]|uniref:DUF6730 family protein n=1 Tax=Salinimicrobium sp. TH3 TaxID=2997342 RepID=UPI002276FB94|nr:DUF6730 family protein [Salinimicrobium sp. TH3]MCY2687521.1 hypothetical protein [Salinimicrobium sp. TH3]
MKKLDEIMELMADEMQDFQHGLLQMKKMTDELNTRSIPITTELMEKQLRSFFQKQQEKEALAAEKLTAIDLKIKNAYILPKNLGMIFGSILILLLTLIGYLSFEVIELKDEEIEEKLMRSYNIYLQENPEQKKIYESWLSDQNIP